ncbi:MAG: M1 family peptidase [Halomonas sp.]|nr:M1 family aminopeptidase [Halomonas sp.]TVP52289.1 MAG: M1 family peptidase [Halomonas sp.]
MLRHHYRCSLLLTGFLALLTSGLAWSVSPHSSTARTLTIQLDPATGTLEGELHQVISENHSFRLLEGLTATSARRGDTSLALTQDADGRWHLQADSDTESSEETVILRWQGTLPEAGNRHRVAIEGSYLPSRAGWYPHLSDAAGPLWLTINVPEGQLAVGSGSLLEEEYANGDGYRARFYHPHTREVEMAAGPWQLRERTVEGVQLRTLFPTALDQAFAETYLNHTADQLALFQARLGPLPYTSFSIAASPAPIGLAFPGFTLLGERVIPLPFIPTTSLPHELMHAWWGAGVNVDYPSGNWSEALTTYLADHTIAQQQGEDEPMRRRWLSDLAALPSSQDSALVDFRGGPDPAKRLVGYQHGALFFHMLRQRIGDEAFDQGLRTLADEWMHRTVDWQTLIDAFSEAAGEPQDAFFTPWLTSPGRPSLNLDAVQVTPHSDGYRVSGLLSQRGEHAPWPLDVPIEVDTEDGIISFVQPMDSQQQPFELSLASRPLTLEIDPSADVLRHPGPMPPILRQLTLDPTTQVLALDDAYHSLAQQLLGREAKLLQGSTGLQEEPRPPLLVIGTTTAIGEWRQDNGLPEPPQPLETAGEARFWMVPGQQPIGLLSGNDVEALAQLTASLRHHGQQSYVVQGADGQTAQAGVWATEESPLKVSFTARDVQ